MENSNNESIFRIKNYKSIKEIILKADKVTILIGPPASGKSNILEALFLIGFIHKLANEKEQYQSNIRNVPPLSTVLRLSTFDDIFYFGLGENIEIGEFEENKIKSLIISNTETNLTIDMPDGTEVHRLPHIRNLLFNYPKQWPHVLNVFSHITRFYAFDRFNALTNMIRLDRQTNVPMDYLDELGRNINNILRRVRLVINIVNDIFGEYGLKIEAKFLREGRFVVFDYNYEVSPNALSDTFYRFLYYLTAIYSNYNYVGLNGLKDKLILLLEEPESHVYPYASKVLAEHIAKTINRLKFIITTHNPHLISAIWDKVKEVTTYYVLRDTTGSTVVYHVNMEKLSEKMVDAYDLLVYKPKKLIEEKILEKPFN